MRLSIFLVLLLFGASAHAATEQSVREPAQPKVVSDRLHSKSQRLRTAITLGVSNRADFHNHYHFSVAPQYFLNETHGAELRVTGQMSEVSSAAKPLVELGFNPHAKQSDWQVSASYLYSPIYGKFAWDSSYLVHFDMTFSAGAGMRFTQTDEIQPYLVAGIRAPFALFGDVPLHIRPEILFRTHAEERPEQQMVFEWMTSLGVTYQW